MSQPFGTGRPLLGPSWAPSQQPSPTRPRTTWELMEERLAAYRLAHNLPPDWRPGSNHGTLSDASYQGNSDDQASRSMWEGLVDAGSSAARGDYSKILPSLLAGVTHLGVGAKALNPESVGTWDNGVPRSYRPEMPITASPRSRASGRPIDHRGPGLQMVRDYPYGEVLVDELPPPTLGLIRGGLDGGPTSPGGVEAGRLAQDWGTIHGNGQGPTLLPRGVAAPGQTQAPTLPPGAQLLGLPPEMRPMIQADNDLAAANRAALARRSDWIRPSTPGRYPNPGPQVSPTPELPYPQDPRYPVSGYAHNRMEVVQTTPAQTPDPRYPGAAAIPDALATRQAALLEQRRQAQAYGLNFNTGHPGPDGEPKLARPDIQPAFTPEEYRQVHDPLSSPWWTPPSETKFLTNDPPDEFRSPDTYGSELDDVGAIAHGPQPSGRPSAAPGLAPTGWGQIPGGRRPGINPGTSSTPAGIAGQPSDAEHSLATRVLGQGGHPALRPADAPERTGPKQAWENDLDSVNELVKFYQGHTQFPQLLDHIEAAAKDYQALQADPNYKSGLPKDVLQSAGALLKIADETDVLEPLMREAQFRATTDPNGRTQSGSFGESVSNLQHLSDVGTALSTAYKTRIIMLRGIAASLGRTTVGANSPYIGGPTSEIPNTNEPGYGRRTTAETKALVGPIRPQSSAPLIKGQDVGKRTPEGLGQRGNYGPGYSGGETKETNDASRPPDFGPLDANGVRPFDPTNPMNNASVAHARRVYQPGANVSHAVAKEILTGVFKRLPPNAKSPTLTLLGHELRVNEGRATTIEPQLGATVRTKIGLRGTPYTESATTGRARPTRPFKDLGRDIAKVFLETKVAKTQAEADQMAAYEIARGGKKQFDAVRIGNHAFTTIAPRTMAGPTQAINRTRVEHAALFRAAEKVAVPRDQWSAKPPIDGKPIFISPNFSRGHDLTWNHVSPILQPILNAGKQGSTIIRVVNGNGRDGKPIQTNLIQHLRAAGFKVELVKPGAQDVKIASTGAHKIIDPTGMYGDGVRWHRSGTNLYLLDAAGQRAEATGATKPTISSRATTGFGPKPK